MRYPEILRSLSLVLLAAALTPFHAEAAKPIPSKDPSAQQVRRMDSSLKGVHPRLLVTPSEVEELRRFYRSPEGRAWREKLDGYLGASRPPGNTKWTNNDTEGQRQGLWRLPTVALHYLLNGDKQSLNRCEDYMREFLKQEDWQKGGERSSGMGAANIMIGAALAYDWCYNDMDPELREKFGEKLFEQARKMYYGGHLNYNESMGYWQGDPANNHRWHRNAGLTLSMLAVYEEKPEQQWMMDKAIGDLEYVNAWLPHDGSCHEGPNYFTFGGNHLALAMQASDKVLGTEFISSDYFKHMGEFRIHTLLPGMQGIFSFGDGGKGSVGGYNNFVLLGATHNKQADVLAGLRQLNEKKDKAYEFGWFSLLWDDPEVKGGKLENLHTRAMFEDIGFAVIRESWADDSVAASFICGPFGGYDLLRYAYQGRKNKYVNVAHDDPDANEFQIAKGGAVLVRTDGYAYRKASKSHNTILINDIGQMSKGRAEGVKYSQPSTSGTMTKMAYLTAFKDTEKVVAVEGEASGSYLEYSGGGKSRPDLDRFRRTFLWMEGDYILVLDDIRAPKDVEVSWLIQSQKITELNRNDHRYEFKADDDSMPMQIVSDQSFTAKIQDSPAENRGDSINQKQLQVDVRTDHARFASVYDPWGRRLEVAIVAQGEDLTWVQVKGSGFEDVWKWEAPTNNETASSVSVNRKSGPTKGLPFELNSADTDIMWKKLAMD